MDPEAAFVLTLMIIVISSAISAGILHSKGRSTFGGFLLGFFLGVPGIVIALFWPAKKAGPVAYSNVGDTASYKVCLNCNSISGRSAAFCSGCGQQF